MNLIITSGKGLEARASAEFKEVALLAGVRKVSLERSAYDGVVEVDAENPKGVLTFLADFVKSEPFKVRYIQRVIPIDAVVDTKMPDISRAVKALAQSIGPGETFRVSIEARDSPYSDKELIDAVADVVDRKVSLSSPDKLVFLQVFGEYTGISVVAPQDILSVTKLKRAV
jgi:tRNA acetyltransferase TAN1